MMIRLIDALCDRHRQQILDSRIWPQRDGTCPDCAHHNTAVRLLPDRDMLPCIALHESAHAVAYLILGRLVDDLRLNPDGTGAVSYRYRKSQPVGVWAGTASVRRMLLTGGTPSEADLIDAVGTGSVGPVSDAELLHEMDRCGVDIWAARDAADLLVAEHWPAIERVADMLLARGRLDGAEIADLAGLAGCNR